MNLLAKLLFTIHSYHTITTIIKSQAVFMTSMIHLMKSYKSRWSRVRIKGIKNKQNPKIKSSDYDSHTHSYQNVFMCYLYLAYHMYMFALRGVK